MLSCWATFKTYRISTIEKRAGVQDRKIIIKRATGVLVSDEEAFSGQKMSKPVGNPENPKSEDFLILGEVTA